MTVTIHKGTASGRMTAPPSKSMAHRCLICAALSGGSTVRGIDFSDDIKATVNCLAALGSDIKIDGNSVSLVGISPTRGIRNSILNCGESGSTLRFLIPLCLLFNKPITLIGSGRLPKRPLKVYEDIFKSQGIAFEQTDSTVKLCGTLQSGVYEVCGDVSSQFISGLMFALPLLEKDSVIKITTRLESASYLNMTMKALGDYGIRINRMDESTFYIKGGQTYKSCDLTVEGDCSNTAFFEALNILGGNIAIEELNDNTCQGDRVYKEYFTRLNRQNTRLDISDCPDLGPVLMALAAAKNGAVLTGTRRLALKESDRGAVMAEELEKFGVPVVLSENGIEIGRAELKEPSQPLCGHNDHRVVMALSVLCTKTGGTITGAQAVSKSLPDFFKRLAALGVEVDCFEA